MLYTLGGAANLKLARSYYSRAVELSQGKSARALWGVTACCANTTEKVRGGASCAGVLAGEGACDARCSGRAAHCAVPSSPAWCALPPSSQVALQDSLTRAVLELPALAADALQQHYREHAPSKLPALQRVLLGSADDA